MLLRAGINYDIKYRMGRDSKEKEFILKSNGMDMSNIQKRLDDFARQCTWDQFHSPKNLSMAISAEAAEILEIFQWLTKEQSKNIA
jgi:hypothetical protein